MVKPGGTYPETDPAGDEIELVGEELTREMKLAYVGRRTVSRYGCYGCHDIPGFETARPIGTKLEDWGRKDRTKLAHGTHRRVPASPRRSRWQLEHP